MTGKRLHRALLLELHERSGGHPQFAIEMATELLAGADRQHALRRRVVSDALAAPLAALPERTLAALEYAALPAVPAVPVLVAATGDKHVIAALEPAENAGLLRIVPYRGELVVQFDPPVVSAIERQMSTARRQARHARLADVVAEPIQRAVHLAAAASGLDERIAADIESGAALALRRGDPVMAARLGEVAVTVTPPDDRPGVQRRLLALAEAQARARMAADVLATLDQVEVARRSADAGRVALMRLPALAEIHGLDVARAAADEASGWIDGPLRAELFRLLVGLDRLRDLRLSAATAARSLDAAHADGSPSWIATATVAEMAGRAAVGQAVDIDAAIAVASSPAADGHTRNELVHLLWYTGDPRGVEWTERVIAIAAAAGDAAYEFNAQMIQANLLIPRGDWPRAEEAVWRALRHGYPDATERALLGFLSAATGRTERAAAIWDELVSAESTRGRTNTIQVEVWRATAAWASGSADAADRLLRVDELAQSIGFAAPRAIAFRRDAVEALVAAGRHDDAHAVAARMRADAARNGLANATADADAAEAVLVAVDGDDDRAGELIAAAIKVHDQCGERYELARSLLTSGRLARRAGRRADARRDLHAAVELFESFDATPWVRRAADELQWIGGRSRSATALTETERLIAGHAAAGKTNTEIAAEVFVAVRTVEANLSRVYRKLGIRSRAQLADALRRVTAG